MDWLDLLAVQGTLKSLLQYHSSKTSNFQHSAFFTVQLSHPYMTTWKTIDLTRWIFVGKIMSLLFNMLSMLVITFLPRSKCLLIPWLQSPSALILESPQNEVWHCFHCLPIYFPWGDGTRCHDLSFLKSTFSLSSFTFIKRLFSSSVSAIRVVSSAYLRLLIFLPAILILACASSSPVFLVMYSAYKLNKQGENIQLWPTLSCVEPDCCSMSSSNCCFLTCIQVSQEAGQVVWYAHLFQNFPQFIVIQTVEGFGVVNKAEIGVFLEFSCFFDDPADIGNLISGSSAFSKTSLNICKFKVHIFLKTGLENFEHYFMSVWDECNCAVVWAFFGIAFLRDWNENWPFPVLWLLMSFPNFLVY